MTSSSVTIVAVGYEVERLFEGQERVIALPDQPARADLQAMTEAVADALGRKEAVLAVYPAWQTEPAAQRLETVRACLDTDRVRCSPASSRHSLEGWPSRCSLLWLRISPRLDRWWSRCRWSSPRWWWPRG